MYVITKTFYYRHLYITLSSFSLPAMMSEDSDYTSDFNYPINSHQGNQPTHQFGGEQPYGVQNNVDTYENADYAQTDYYDNYDGTSYERVYGDQRYERGRERDYYMYQMETNYHQPRSDTDSEPLYYNSRPNSRPQSLITDRYVCYGLNSISLSLFLSCYEL